MTNSYDGTNLMSDDGGYTLDNGALIDFDFLVTGGTLTTMKCLYFKGKQ